MMRSSRARRFLRVPARVFGSLRVDCADVRPECTWSFVGQGREVALHVRRTAARPDDHVVGLQRVEALVHTGYLLVSLDQIIGDPVAVLAAPARDGHRPVASDASGVISTPRLSAFSAGDACAGEVAVSIETATISVVSSVFVGGVFLDRALLLLRRD